MSHPALVLKEHLANIHARLDRIDKELTGFMQRMTAEIGKLDRGKLSVEEFREFVDIFNKTLVQGLSSPDEEPVQAEVKQESSGESNVEYQKEAVVVLNQNTNTELHTTETYETPDMTKQMVITERTSFPMRVDGEVFRVGDGVTSIVGDVEIPSGTTVNETLVVKGNLRVCDSCRLLKDIKASKDVTVGANTTVEGNLVSGGMTTVGFNCVVHGSIESHGDVDIGDNVVVRGSLRSKSSIVLNRLVRVFQTIYAVKGVFVLKAKQNV